MDPQQVDAEVDQKRFANEDSKDEEEKRPPIYHVDSNLGHFGACHKLVHEKKGADPTVYEGLWSNIHNGLQGEHRNILSTYWMAALRDIEVGDHNYKEHQLPLARIKKVMKADPEVKMISAEAPILFAKGCDIFITELTMRAWIHAEDNKRRTLQRSDIAAALTKSDMFDFLIDIVPREEVNAAATKRSTSSGQAASAGPQQSQSAPAQPGQSMGAVQSQHHPSQGYEHDPYHRQDHDPYSQQAMYGHPVNPYAPYPPPQMDPNAGMYYATMPPQQMHYMQPQQMQPPRQDHGSVPPPNAYQPYPGPDRTDAEGETE